MKLKSLYTSKEKSLFRNLNSPIKIQKYLNTLDYNIYPECCSPRQVIKNQRANCSEGAIFAAACLQFHNQIPFIMDLRAEKTKDDDHVIAIYKFEGKLGAIAKSNFTTLRFREPVYNNIRELGMSYFDFYFNSKGEKTLRELSELLDLSFFDKKSWQISKQEIDYITQKLDEMAHHQIASEKIIKNLNLVDKNLLEAGLLGSNPKGLFKI